MTAPASGTEGYIWTWNGSQWIRDSDNSVSSPSRQGDTGAFMIVDTDHLQPTNAGNTADGGGIKVADGVTVSAMNLGTWAGTIQVGAGARLITSAEWLKNMATNAANVWVDGELTIDNLAKFDNGATAVDQNWHIGQDGFVNLYNTSSLAYNGKKWNIELVVNNNAAEIEGLSNRSRSNYTENRTFIATRGDIYNDALCKLTVIDAAGNTLSQDSYSFSHGASGFVVSYNAFGYEQKSLTWNGAADDVWVNKGDAWKDSNGTTTSFLNKDSVTFDRQAGNTRTVVSIGGKITTESIIINDYYTFTADEKASIHANSFTISNDGYLKLHENVALSFSSNNLDFLNRIQGNAEVSLTASELRHTGGLNASGFTGSLNVGSGMKLYLGGNQSHVYKLGQTSIILNEGSLFEMNGSYSQLGALSVAGNSTLFFRDGDTGKELLTVGQVNIAKNTTLTVQNEWEGIFTIKSLNAEGNLTIGLNNRMSTVIQSIAQSGAILNNQNNHTLSLGEKAASVLNLGGNITNKGTLNIIGALSGTSDISGGTINVKAGTSIARGADITFSSGINLEGTLYNEGSLTIGGSIVIGEAYVDNFLRDSIQYYTQDKDAESPTSSANGYAYYNCNKAYLVDGTGTVDITADTITFGDKGEVALDKSETGKVSFNPGVSGFSAEYYVNVDETLAYNKAAAYILADSATVTLSGELAGDIRMPVSGNGTVEAKFAADNHDNGLKLGNDFNGTLRITGGNMSLSWFSYGEHAVLELVKGESYRDARISNEVRLSAADIGSSYNFKYSTVTIDGKVTGNYLQVTGSDGGSLTLTNADNEIDWIRVTGRTLNIKAGTVGHLEVKGGTVNLTGTTSFAQSHDVQTNPYTRNSGLYAEGNSTVNIGNGAEWCTITIPRVEMGDNSSATLNVKRNATLVVTDGDVNGSQGYWRTGFLLGEWNGSSTLNVEGTLLVQNAHIAHGDNTGTVNIKNGGVVATKGIYAAKNNGAANANGRINLNMEDGGKLILGDGGIDVSNMNAVLGAGTIGITANAVIAENLALSSAEGTIFDTQKYVWGDNGEYLMRGTEGGVLTISGVVSDYSVTSTEGEGEAATTTTTKYPGKLVKDGAGELKLTATNAYSGGTMVKAGTLTVAAADALGSGDVVVEKGAALALSNNATFANNISGAGDYRLGNKNAAIQGKLTEDWTGTVYLNEASFDKANLGVYGNANSTISLTKTSGTLAEQKVSSHVVFASANAADFEWKGSDASANITFAGKVSGDGNIAFSSGKEHQIAFTGDVSEWTGVIWGSVSGGTNITYSGNATEINHEVRSGVADKVSGVTNVTYKTAGNMVVNGNINTDTWAKGIVNLTVQNEGDSKGTVEFTGAVSNDNASGATNITVKAGASAMFTNEAGNVKLHNVLLESQAALSFTTKDVLNVNNLEVADVGTITVANGETAGSIKASGAVTLNGGATINAAVVDLSGASSVSFDVASGAIALNGALTMSSTEAFVTALGDSLAGLTAGEMLTVFTGVSSFKVGDVTYDASNALTNVDLRDWGADAAVGQYTLTYDTSANVGSIVITVGEVIPEPASATLSLAALMMLCARRRRRA